MSEPNWRAAGERIETLIAASATGGAVAQERAEELVRVVVDLYGAGLERLLDLLHEREVLSDDLLAALAGDDLVAGLLLVHGLHPYAARTRIEQALAGLPHGGDVEVLEVSDDGVVRLRMLGGCASSGAALKQAVRSVVEAAAPEVTAIEVEESRPGTVIPVAALFSRLTETAEQVS